VADVPVARAIFLWDWEKPTAYMQGKPIEIVAPKKVEAKYVNQRGQVRLEKFEAHGDDFDFILEIGEPRGREVEGRARIRIRDKTTEFGISEPHRAEIGTFEPGPLVQLLLSSRAFAQTSSEPESAERSRLVAEVANRLLPMAILSRGRVLSVAPIRTKPERTYSQITETFKPTGDHIPFLLDQVLQEVASTERKRLIDALNAFGSEAHLFEKLTVKHLGKKKATDPFELMVTVAGKTANLVDVGYGVSQSLPVVVQSTLRSRGQMLLLQQPEVHLHPRAQAALGSFFASLASSDTGSLLVETHSDYIIDRVRQEVAKERLAPERVTILYLHRKGSVTIPHELGIDLRGNLTNAPPYYREFFLQEELNLFNRVRA
jgi:hypothetical protein